MDVVESLARNLGLGSLLSDLRTEFGGYEILDHWQRGEFHHDLLLKVRADGKLPGPVLVVATNCNGGVKEILSFGTPPRGGAVASPLSGVIRVQRRVAVAAWVGADRPLVRSVCVVYQRRT